MTVENSGWRILLSSREIIGWHRQNAIIFSLLKRPLPIALALAPMTKKEELSKTEAETAARGIRGQRLTGFHPHPAQLERFMRGELSREEAFPLVRHLLAVCPKCLPATRRLWFLGGAGL